MSKECTKNTANSTDETLLSSPLARWHDRLGARMVPFAGMSLPVQYTGLKSEHLATRQQAGLFDISHMLQMRIDGAARSVLQNALVRIFPINFATLLPGQSRYSFLLNPQGGILDDVIVSDVGDHFLVVANGARRRHDPAYICQHLPTSLRLQVIRDCALLALQGPSADTALQKLIPDRPDLFFMHQQICHWQNQPLHLFRQGYTGEDGWEISLPSAMASNFADALLDTDLVTPCGLGARDSLRLEAGLPLWGHDINAQISPVQAGLDFAIAKNLRQSGTFIGHAALKAQWQQPPQTQRVGIVIESKQPAREGVLLYVDERAIGRITSGGISPSLSVPIAMAMVDRTHAALNTRLEAEVRGKRLAARVCALPFVPLHYHHKKRKAS